MQQEAALPFTCSAARGRWEAPCVRSAPTRGKRARRPSSRRPHADTAPAESAGIPHKRLLNRASGCQSSRSSLMSHPGSSSCQCPAGSLAHGGYSCVQKGRVVWICLIRDAFCTLALARGKTDGAAASRTVTSGAVHVADTRWAHLARPAGLQCRPRSKREFVPLLANLGRREQPRRIGGGVERRAVRRRCKDRNLGLRARDARPVDYGACRRDLSLQTARPTRRQPLS